MIRKILKTTNPKLREHSMPVTRVDKKLFELIRDMEETLDNQKDPEGLGLAAPQVGVFQRLFVLKPPNSKAQVFINPEIVKLSKKTNDIKKKMEPTSIMEGCLSLPHYYGPVRRAHSVTIKFHKLPQNFQLPTEHAPTANVQLPISNFPLREKTLNGFFAHIVQHEIDHLNGVFFVDHLLKTGRKLYQMKGKEWYEVKLL